MSTANIFSCSTTFKSYSFSQQTYLNLVAGKPASEETMVLINVVSAETTKETMQASYHELEPSVESDGTQS